MQAACTFEAHLAELARLRDPAEKSGNFGAAVQAEVSRGKASRFYVEQTEDLTYSPEKLQRQLQVI